MSSMPKIKVVPVRSSEWVMPGTSFDRSPEPFTIALQTSEPRHWAGVVLDTGHVFEGRRVDITQRHTGSAGEVEVTVAPVKHGHGIALGWAVFDPPLRSS